MNASNSLYRPMLLNIRLMLVGMPAWRRKTEIRVKNLTLNLYFCLFPYRQADQHQSNEV